MMTTDGLVDGSWELTIIVTDLQVERTLRVKGDLHIGGVMLKLVESLDFPADWSDHGLYWPEKSLWLLRTKSTLDQYGVQADCRLWFTPMHKTLQVMLPDLQVVDMQINFSINIFRVVVKICKELGIRHPEELSLSRKIDKEELKRNRGVSAIRRTQVPGLSSPNGHMTSPSYDSATFGSLFRRSGVSDTTQGTLSRDSGMPRSPFGTLRQSPNYSFNANGTMSPGSVHSILFDGAIEQTLANSPLVSVQEAFARLYRPRSLAEKARINAGWLDSSRSLLEQGVCENDVILLRFKFFTFYELTPKYDAVRINQLYEQAKWSLISEEIDCTEEEMMIFAALQLQIQQQSLLPQPDLERSLQTEDEVDAALNDLQVTLEGSTLSDTTDITQTPELRNYMRFFKPKKVTFKSFKRYFFVFKETVLSIYRSAESVDQSPVLKFSIRGCEVTSDVNLSSQKFNIKLFVPSEDGGGMTEMWIRQDTEEQYAHWMAAFRLASKGRTMADSSYESEVRSLQSFLNMQHPVSSPTSANVDLQFDPANYVAPRFLNKVKSVKQLAKRILDAQSNVQGLNLMEAKMTFIKAWQSLPEYGLTYFIIKMRGSKKEELLAVTFNRLVRMDLAKGDSLKTWRFQNMKEWNVNWDIKEVVVEFEEDRVAFHCLTADCKVVHEFIGGYIFLSMRSGDRNQTLNEEQFQKLTGGWL